MEPAATEDYSKQVYWDTRYSHEDTYEWFNSVYSPCLAKLTSLVINVLRAKLLQQKERDSSIVLEVLHLGCGNSGLCHDLAQSIASAANSTQAIDYRGVIQLHQVAVDYSPVVIEKMKQRFSTLNSSAAECPPQGCSVANNVEWVVGDVRRLAFPPSQFDIVIDKGTMDALQADKSNEKLDDDLHEMMLGVSHVLKKGGFFVQVTWEVPYYRFFITKRDEYEWSKAQSEHLEGSDMYYFFTYEKKVA